MLRLAVELRLGMDELESVGSAIVGGEGARLYIVAGSRMIQKRSM